VNIDQYLHARTGSNVAASEAGYNNFALGLQRLFRTKDHHVEGQAFMCDARGDTTSTGGVAVRIGAKVVTFMRPYSVGTDPTNGAWGKTHLSRPKWRQDVRGETFKMGMDMTINGKSIPFTDLGPNPGHSSRQGSLPVAGDYTKGSWFAQQLFMPEGKDSCVDDNIQDCGLWNPTCVGDRNRSLLIKASVPSQALIYEPIITIELTQRLVDDLEESSPDTPWLCMGPEHQQDVKTTGSGRDINYEDSIFTVAQLYQLCFVCDMNVAGAPGTQNAVDVDSWVSSNGLAGCIHPDPVDKFVTGSEVCAAISDLELAAATAACTPIFQDEPFWFDSCLAEFCNTDDDRTGVHAEAKNTASNLKHLMEIEAAELDSVNEEFADKPTDE
jgi:hypothetical protein